MSKWLSVWLALWSELWKLKKMLLGRSHSHSQFGQMWQLHTCINSIVWRLNTTNNSANCWLKCRQIVWGLRVHSLHLSSGKLGRRFIPNLLHRSVLHSCSATVTSLRRKTINFQSGLLSSRSRNRTTRSLIVRVCLKMNMGIFLFIWFSVTDSEKEVNAKCPQ